MTSTSLQSKQYLFTEATSADIRVEKDHRKFIKDNELDCDPNHLRHFVYIFEDKEEFDDILEYITGKIQVSMNLWYAGNRLFYKSILDRDYQQVRHYFNVLTKIDHKVLENVGETDKLVEVNGCDKPSQVLLELSNIIMEKREYRKDMLLLAMRIDQRYGYWKSD